MFEAESRRDIETEAQIYEHLGQHSRLVRMVSYSHEEGLLLEYMPNGCLKDYLHTHGNTIPTKQRLQWACEAAEGLHLLHTKGVIHSDTKPSNLLLDGNLGLRIADFSGSSLNGSHSSANEGTRFWLPRDWREPSTIHTDLFALGSTIYQIMTGMSPFEDLPSKEVERRYKAQEYPDLAGIICGECIQRCWRSEIDSAQEVHDLIEACDVGVVCKSLALPHICRLPLMDC